MTGIGPTYTVTVRIPADLRDRMRYLIEPRDQNRFIVKAIEDRVQSEEAEAEQARRQRAKEEGRYGASNVDYSEV